MDYDDENTFASVAWDRDAQPGGAVGDEDPQGHAGGAAPASENGTAAASTSAAPPPVDDTTEVILSEKLEVTCPVP